MWLNIVEFAKDPRAKLCARAILDYMLADLAINSHHGIIIPPASRAKGLVKEDQMLSTLRPNTQWTGWLYWDAGNGPQTQEDLDKTVTTCRDSVMDVNDGTSGFQVNWQNNLPEYTYYDV